MTGWQALAGEGFDREEYAAGGAYEADQGPEESAGFERNLVFVATDGNRAPEVAAAIEAACAGLGLRTCRVEPGKEPALKQIIELIRRSEFLIFNLTGARPEMFYALGYAHGVGNEALDILALAQSGTALGIDLAPLRVQYYDSAAQLGAIVTARLGEMMQQTRR